MTATSKTVLRGADPRKPSRENREKMKVLISRPWRPGDEIHQMHLEPESDRDRETLDRLVNKYRIDGFGRDANSGNVLHVQIRLIRRGEYLRHKIVSNEATGLSTQTPPEK